MPPSPWQLLGLDPASATEAEVKAAYSRLLRLHRPDQDPAGFQALRQAFEEARDQILRRSGPGEGAPATSPQMSQPAVPAEESFAGTVYHELRAAIARLTPAQIAQPNEFQAEFRQLREVFFASFSAARGKAATMRDFSAQAVRALQGKPALLAALMSPDMLVLEIATGGSALAAQTLLVWEETNRHSQLEAFRSSLTTQASSLRTDGAALAMAQLASDAGFFLPRLGSDLANAAFPILPPSQRAEVMRGVESVLSLGKVFEPFPMPQRRFWWGRVFEASADWDWENASSSEARDYLLRHQSTTWTGWQIIHSLTPSGWLDKKATMPFSRRAELSVKPAEDEDFWDLDDPAPSTGGPKPTTASASRGNPPSRESGVSASSLERTSAVPRRTSRDREALPPAGRRRGKPRRSPIGRLFGRRSLRGTLPGLFVLALLIAIVSFLLYHFFQPR